MKFEGWFADNGKENGRHAQWYSDGKILSDEYYSYGYKLSHQKGWYPDGREWYIFNYAKDETQKEMDLRNTMVTSLNGLQETWYPNGQKAENSNFSNGKRHGLQEGWHPNGQKAYIETYENGSKTGKCQSWDERGVIIEDKEYVIIISKKNQKRDADQRKKLTAEKKDEGEKKT